MRRGKKTDRQRLIVKADKLWADLIKRSDEWCSYIEENSIPEPMSGCWLWLGHLKHNAKAPIKYGAVYTNNVCLLAHRVSYLAFSGWFDPELCICHRCDNPACVNPEHLFPGTYADNNTDRSRKGRTRAPRCLGEKHGMSKLTAADVVVIRARKSAGERAEEIAADFEIAASTVFSIANRSRWGHVES